ncbi:hypothetical protein CK203_087243 [Vitis vinifera]|uniref:Uncharacterized protein n=1 Tax=Vitis vinifera TaxID=29760 RepID=A0A438BM09_VITVI|nr:hypothetical protein CK203_087243 [Vitis vinifera]
MSLMTLYFLDEINEHETFVEIRDIVDGAMPHDEFTDEMLTISLSQIKEIFQLELASPFYLCRVSVIEIAEEILTALAPESTKDAIVVDDLFDGLLAYLIDQRVSPATGDAEVVDFGIVDQPRELRIGLDLSTDERDGLT